MAVLPHHNIKVTAAVTEGVGEQEDREPKAILGYTASSKPAWDTGEGEREKEGRGRMKERERDRERGWGETVT